MDLYGSLVANEGSGGGGGTADVPIKSISVNGSGVVPVNKNVNIDIPTKTSELQNDSNFASTNDIPTKVSELDNDSKFVTEDELTAKGYASTNDIPTKVSQLENDSNFASTSDIPTKTSQLTNDSSFVTESDLTAKDYADKTYVGEQIAQSEHLKREIVTVLPEPSVADEHTIYMIKDDSVKGSDKYKEYILIEGVVQCVGDTSVDLTDYAKTADIPTELPANGGNADTVNGHTVGIDVPENAVFTDTTYSDATQIEHGLMSVDDKKKLDGLTKYTPDGNTITADEDGTLHGQSVDLMTVDNAGIGKPDGETIEVSTDATISVSSKALTFADHDTATSGTSFTDAEDGNMLVTDWTKNLLNPTLETTTKNGVTCTNNGDGTYTLNGTATTEINFNIGNINLQSKEYRITGTPLGYGTKDRVSIRNSDYSKTAGDWGVGNNIDGDVFKENCVVYILISSGSSFENVIFKPMITTDLSATYDDFVPYGGYEIQSCGKNLFDILKCNYNSNDGGSYAINGETLEINSTVSGASGIFTHDMNEYFIENIGGKIKISFDAKASVGGKLNVGAENIAIFYFNVGTEYERKVLEFTILNKPTGFVIYNHGGLAQTFYIKNFIIEKVDEFDGVPTPFEPYTGETIAVTNDTEFPAFGLKSHKCITNIISPGNVKCVYPTNESGKGVLDSLYNKDKMLTEQNKSLGGLSFSASGTTLTITDGTNTWTLGANN